MSLLARGFALGRHPSCRDQILPWQKKGGLDHLSESSVLRILLSGLFDRRFGVGVSCVDAWLGFELKLLCPVGRARRNGWAAAMEGSVGPRVYSCSNCGNHVCLHDDIISKAFHVNPVLHLRLCSFFYDKFAWELHDQFAYVLEHIAE